MNRVSGVKHTIDEADIDEPNPKSRKPEANWSLLPPDMIFHAMTFLPTGDLNNSKLVCREWSELNNKVWEDRAKYITKHESHIFRYSECTNEKEHYILSQYFKNSAKEILYYYGGGGPLDLNDESILRAEKDIQKITERFSSHAKKFPLFNCLFDTDAWEKNKEKIKENALKEDAYSGDILLQLFYEIRQWKEGMSYTSIEKYASTALERKITYASHLFHETYWMDDLFGRTWAVEAAKCGDFDCLENLLSQLGELESGLLLETCAQLIRDGHNYPFVLWKYAKCLLEGDVKNPKEACKIYDQAIEGYGDEEKTYLLFQAAEANFILYNDTTIKVEERIVILEKANRLSEQAIKNNFEELICGIKWHFKSTVFYTTASIKTALARETTDDKLFKELVEDIYKIYNRLYEFIWEREEVLKNKVVCGMELSKRFSDARNKYFISRSVHAFNALIQLYKNENLDIPPDLGTLRAQLVELVKQINQLENS